MKHVKDFNLTDHPDWPETAIVRCKALSLYSQKHIIILYYYSIFKNVCSHISRAWRGYVYILEQMFDCQKGHIWCFHTLTPILSSIPSSTKPWKINVFRHFNITKNHHILPKNPLNPYKIRLQSNLIKIFKKSIQIIQNRTLPPTPFHQQKSSIFRNPIIKKSLSHRTHQKSHHKFNHH